MTSCTHRKSVYKCNICKPDKFCIHNRSIYDSCQQCKRHLCQHQNNKWNCNLCYPDRVKVRTKCVHNKRKSDCIQCGGRSVCIHNRQKARCIECTGCVHGKRKSRCEVCSGTEICEHNINKYGCKVCNSKILCIHDKIKRNCKDCNGSAYCDHDKLKIQCRICCPTSFCSHGKRRNMCNLCSGHTKVFCKVCHLFIVGKSTDHYCSYCNPNSPQSMRRKEEKIRRLFEEDGLKFINNRQFENDCCLKYRPDFVMDCTTYYLIVEVDENAHRGYDQQCEIVRMNNVSIGLGLPVKWIRYNPDSLVDENIKHKELLREVTEWKDKPMCDNLEVIYLFYT